METVNAAHRIAANVRAEMGRQQITQTKLAEVLRLSQPAVSRRLSGQVAFNVDELAVIASVFGVALTALVEVAA